MFFKIILCALMCHLGHSVRITSTGQTINVNTQQTREVTMTCEVQLESSENLLRNIVYWFKIQDKSILNVFKSDQIITKKINNQDTTISEELERAIGSTYEMASLLSPKTPFEDSNKFTFKEEEPATGRHVISLKISNLDDTDSGVYVCAVKQSDVQLNLLTSDYMLNILQQVSTVSMTGAPEVMANMSHMNMNQDSPFLTYYHLRNGYLECKSEGGYPAPHLSVFIDEQRKSGFGLNEEYVNYTMLGSTGGRQTITPIKWVNSSTILINKEMNNKKIRCQAQIRTANSTFHNTTVEKTLIVYYKPDIKCDKNVKIPLGKSNIAVKCNIYARPVPQITWNAKSSNVKVASNDVTQNDLGLKAVTDVATGKDDLFVATLTFDLVKSEHFQEYDVVAENKAGRGLISVKIENGELRVEASNSASSLTLAALLVFLAATVHVFMS